MAYQIRCWCFAALLLLTQSINLSMSSFPTLLLKALFFFVVYSVCSLLIFMWSLVTDIVHQSPAIHLISMRSNICSSVTDDVINITKSKSLDIYIDTEVSISTYLHIYEPRSLCQYRFLVPWLVKKLICYFKHVGIPLLR